MMIKFGPYIERAYAREINSLYYITGRPCKNGHIDKKLTSSNKCESCKVRTDDMRAYDAAWKREKRKDPEFVAKERQQRGRWLEKDGVREELYKRNSIRNKKRYREDDEFRSNILLKTSERQKENKDQRKKTSKEWRDRNPEKVRMANHYRRDHRKITEGRDASISLNEVFKKNLGFCVYCSSPLFEGYHLDHIMPLSLGGGNVMANLQCLCAGCNLRKGAKHPDEWHRILGWHTEQIKG